MAVLWYQPPDAGALRLTPADLNNPRRVAEMLDFLRLTRRGGEISLAGRRNLNPQPTVVSDVPKDARAMNEEPFGPLALISRFSSFDDVVEEANRLPFGLASYAFTSSAKTAAAIGAAVEAGMMSINSFGLALPEVPFGGIKDSGYGSEGGTEAMEGYFNTKFISQTGV